MTTREPHSIIAVILALAVMAGTAITGIITHTLKSRRVELRPVVNGIIAFPKSRSAELIVGYNYYLLNRIAASNGSEISMKITHNPSAAIDSLRAGSIELAAISPADSALVDSTMVSMLADSMAIWVFNRSFEDESVHLKKWLDEYSDSNDYRIIRQHFMHIYNPFRKVSADFISPYDSLLKVHADTLGWDWKLLAAVVYQESRFKIEAESPCGASGLMQMMPVSHRKLTEEDMTDPEKNIRAGTAFLAKLYRKYKNAANVTERQKFTLAAYNAGAGRIRDCINFARFRGVDTGYWDNIVSVIPEMRDSSFINSIDTVKLGTFQGYETIGYVKNVMDIYEQYKRICP